MNWFNSIIGIFTLVATIIGLILTISYQKRNNSKNIEENLEKIEQIPINIEGIYLMKTNEVDIRGRLVSLKSSIKELDVILSKDCEIHCFKEHILILKNILIHLEDVESFRSHPQKINESNKGSISEEKEYIKLASDLQKNKDKINIIRNYPNYALYKDYETLRQNVNQLIDDDDINIKGFIRLLKNYIHNFLKLIRQYKEAYVNENQKEIDRIIMESDESRLFYLLMLDFYKDINTRNKTELGVIISHYIFYPEFQCASEGYILLRHFIKNINQASQNSVKHEIFVT